MEYVTNICNVDPKRLKYLDECHFVSRHLWKRRAISPINTKVRVVASEDISSSYTLTLMTNISLEANIPWVAALREDSNTQFDFVKYVIECAENGYIKEGDILICGNASVHFSIDTYDILVELLDKAGAHLIFLPAYSPELNPCELVFAYAKSTIRSSRNKNRMLWGNILHVLLTLKKELN